MDYKEILKEQFHNVVDLDQIDEISKETYELSEGLSESFSLEKILESTLNGESFFYNQELISGIKDLALYEIRNAMILGVEILIICVVIGLLKNLSASFGSKSMSDISMLVCTMVIIGISMNSFRIVYQLALDSVSVMVSTMEILTPILLGIMISTGAVTSGSILSPVIIGSGYRIWCNLEENYPSGTVCGNHIGFDKLFNRKRLCKQTRKTHPECVTYRNRTDNCCSHGNYYNPGSDYRNI